MNEEMSRSESGLSPKPHLTMGQYLVGISFNPGGLDSVNDIKKAAADLIDLVGRHGVDARTRALAITNIEQGAMWAVKSATKPTRE